MPPVSPAVECPGELRGEQAGTARGVDRSRAASLGVSIEDVSRTLQILFGGLDLSRIKVEGKDTKSLPSCPGNPGYVRRTSIESLYGAPPGTDSTELPVTRSEGPPRTPSIITPGRLRCASITASREPFQSVPWSRWTKSFGGNSPGFLYAWEGTPRIFGRHDRDLVGARPRRHHCVHDPGGPI